MTGKLALKAEPTYIPDLREFKSRTRESLGKYFMPMFGGPLADDQTWEVIVLPLSFAGEPIGVVTMHRRKAVPIDTAVCGFATRKPSVLMEAAECLSIYVAALDKHDRIKWQHRELQRITAVGRQLLEEVPFGAKLLETCKLIVEEYRACLCSVYLIANDSAYPSLKVHFKRQGCQYPVPELIEPDKDDPMWRAFFTAAPKEVRVPSGEDEANLDKVKRELRVERVCLPLLDGRKAIGVVDLRWADAPLIRANESVPRHDVQYLELLAAELASAITAHHSRIDQESARERSARAVDAMSIMLRRGVHGLAKGIQSICDGLANMTAVGPTPELQEIIEDCSATAEQVTSVLRRARDAGNRLTSIQKSPCRLDSLLNEALSKYRKVAEEKGITVQFAPKEVWAELNPSMILDCFDNVIDNAVKAMSKQGCLDISIRITGGQCEVLISDTGPGMSKEKVERILGGERPDPESKGGGMGLFLTRLYCQNHGGDMQIESNLGAGTTIKLTFPHTEGG